MNKILLIGKMNDVVKNLHALLARHFQVQLSEGSTAAVRNMLGVVSPDVVILSLVGAVDIDPVLFNILMTEYPHLPVLTIGTESERSHFLKYYENQQFENLIRPISNTTVLVSLGRRLGWSEAQVAEMLDKEKAYGKPQILVVDDNASTLRSIKGMLEEHYDVMLANSGIKAMTAIGKRRPALILLDYEMPVCDGRQTLEMIRADEELADIPVIFLTGVSDREHIQAVVGLHPAGYLLKPPIKEKILEAIAKALGE